MRGGVWTSPRPSLLYGRGGLRSRAGATEGDGSAARARSDVRLPRAGALRVARGGRLRASGGRVARDAMRSSEGFRLGSAGLALAPPVAPGKIFGAEPRLPRVPAGPTREFQI